MDLKNVDTLSHWDKWKEALGKAVNVGEKMGLSENTIDNIGTKVGDFLSANVDPENREQRVLQELWRSGDDHDRKTLTKMLVNMVQKETLH
ncbi:MAG TPA: DUF3243 domain-containing protein [Patescibacteria group bacterium]|nr:DUF3243 domain-containing protein [Patescibacteria group bacterium]